MRDALALRPAPVVLAGYDASAQPLADIDGKGWRSRASEQAKRLTKLQTMLYAEGTQGRPRRLLLVLQGMDTAGKGGVTNHVVGSVQPIGVQYTAFKKPTDEELAHDFLWRIRPRLPLPGVIGVFDRSHYEDVLVPWVHGTIDEQELERRYQAINDFEAEIAAQGTTIIKCFLHISYETQRERLLARVDSATKRWKFNEADLAERTLWSHYTVAYEALLTRCSSSAAPWFVVPADSKKYRNWAVGQLLRETLEAMDLHYPQPDLDWAELRRALIAQGVDQRIDQSIDQSLNQGASADAG
jgi:PPK2 family polyphosphate:nucleotide phosphotransferase